MDYDEDTIREKTKQRSESGITKAIMSASKFCKLDYKPKRILLDPWVAEQMLILITGFRGIGKTWFTLTLSDAIANGVRFGPWEVLNNTKVLYLEGEMTVVDVIDRMKQINPDHKKNDRLFIYSDAYATVQHEALPANLRDEKWRDEITSILLDGQYKVFVIDNITSLLPGASASDDDTWSVINYWLRQLRANGVTVILIHHPGKSGDQLGTSTREFNLDVSLMLQKKPGYKAEDGIDFIVEFTKTRIPFVNLHKIRTLNLNARPDEDGKLCWLYQEAESELTFRVLSLLNDGYNQTIAGEELGINQSRVSRIRKKAIKDGWFTEKNEWTQSGFFAAQGLEHDSF
jgi:putative DNA primase/helicase